jgi:hypothetical protein
MKRLPALVLLAVAFGAVICACGGGGSESAPVNATASSAKLTIVGAAS